ncbi:dead end protein homolog 1 [Eublepharis macularius]|uniref:Dead end protein homolog 1 n=1 Tax=Eublepharis macularius TaxID=481883 RepID=A0AA97JM96_EUBMA|nr:dead end protein homolog 1 [Eublepharis macularius]
MEGDCGAQQVRMRRGGVPLRGAPSRFGCLWAGVQAWTEEVNRANKAALWAWVRETGVRLVQVNGQRKFGGPPPGWAGGTPPSGAEVFIGKIPQEVYEDKLIPVFQRVGKLYEFRLMMTFSGLNRGFAYAKYSNRRSAQEAIGALNGFEIQPGHPIVVCRSTEKCELSIDGLALSVQQRQLQQLLSELTVGVASISLHPSPFQKGKQFAGVKYISHRAAAMAKKVLVEGSLSLCGNEIEVDWLKPNRKHELHSSVQALSEILPSNCSADDAPGQEASRPLDPHVPLAAGNALDYLNLQCEERKLGPPVFLTKCMQRNPGGWLQYWYQVVIPNFPSPFSGLIWIKQDHSVVEDHEKAKNAVALQLLKVLGCPVV